MMQLSLLLSWIIGSILIHVDASNPFQSVGSPADLNITGIDPKISSLGPDHLLVTWLGTEQAPPKQVFGCIYNSEGVPQGDAFQVLESTVQLVTKYSVLVTKEAGMDSDYLIYYAALDANKGLIRGRWYTSSQAAATEIQLSPSSFQDARSPRMSRGPSNTGLALVFTGTDAAGFGVFVQMLDMSGNQEGNAINVAYTDPSPNPAIVIPTESWLWVSWVSQRYTYIKGVGADGSLTAEQEIDIPPSMYMAYGNWLRSIDRKNNDDHQVVAVGQIRENNCNQACGVHISAYSATSVVGPSYTLGDANTNIVLGVQMVGVGASDHRVGVATQGNGSAVFSRIYSGTGQVAGLCEHQFPGKCTGLRLAMLSDYKVATLCTSSSKILLQIGIQEPTLTPTTTPTTTPLPTTTSTPTSSTSSGQVNLTQTRTVPPISPSPSPSPVPSPVPSPGLTTPTVTPSSSPSDLRFEYKIILKDADGEVEAGAPFVVALQVLRSADGSQASDEGLEMVLSVLIPSEPKGKLEGDLAKTLKSGFCVFLVRYTEPEALMLQAIMAGALPYAVGPINVVAVPKPSPVPEEDVLQPLMLGLLIVGGVVLLLLIIIVVVNIYRCAVKTHKPPPVYRGPDKALQLSDIQPPRRTL